MLREISEKDREFLFAMRNDAYTTRFGDILARLGVTSGYASKYRQRLLESGLLIESGHGQLAYAPPYLREYLAQLIN
jgi:DNA-binding Lrp family transcriptional regulator